jgi:hypothetical protein
VEATLDAWACHPHTAAAACGLDAWACHPHTAAAACGLVEATLDAWACHPHTAAAACGLAPRRAQPFLAHLVSLHCALQPPSGLAPTPECACCGGAGAAAALGAAAAVGRLLSPQAARALVELAVDAPVRTLQLPGPAVAACESWRHPKARPRTLETLAPPVGKAK